MIESEIVQKLHFLSISSNLALFISLCLENAYFKLLKGYNILI